MFMGSGTTAVACQKLNRQFIGIEIDEKYCEITKGRLSQNNLFKPARKQAAGKQLKCELED
jgi:site-specific DNA-methyltransferase (adenine-specific)